jgi:hypothetical protein
MRTVSFWRLAAKNWHFMRLLRAGVAFWAFAEAWRSGEWLLLVPGSLFAVQAIFDVGCCGAAGCSPVSQQQKSVAAEEVSYEEVR